MTYVVNQGKIVEQGNHAGLLAQRGLHSQLYGEQFGAGRIECHWQDGMIHSDGTVVIGGTPVEASALVGAGAPAAGHKPILPLRE